MYGAEDGDPAMLELFRAELDAHLPTLGEGLLALEKNPDQPKLLESMMRAAHSIKGAARIVGVNDAVQVSHVMEDCFVAAQRGELRLSASGIDAMLQGLDVLSHTAQSSEPFSPDRLAVIVAAIAAAKTGQPAAVVVPPPPVSVAPQVVKPVTLAHANWDAAGSETLRNDLLQRSKAGANPIRLDATAITELHPQSLAVLASFAELQQRSSSPTRLELVNARVELARVIRLSGLAASWHLVTREG